MSESSTTPHRLRWFQFSLGTWLLVVAIVGWAMTMWPWIVTPSPAREDAVRAALKWLAKNQTEVLFQEPFASLVEEQHLNPALAWPALALAAAVLWKVVNGVRHWRASRTTQPNSGRP